MLTVVPLLAVYMIDHHNASHWTVLMYMTSWNARTTSTWPRHVSLFLHITLMAPEHHKIVIYQQHRYVASKTDGLQVANTSPIHKISSLVML